jgi:Restriction endonuclease/Topoisomerase DNA binding C4 zinc finger
MARRRRRDDDWVEPVVGLAGLAVLAFMLIPDFHELIFTIGIIALVLVGGVFFGLVIHRLATPGRRMQPTIGNVFAPASFFPDEKTGADTPQPRWPPGPSSVELIGQVRSMDWFQFEKLVGHVYKKLGYAVNRRGGANPDGGIDLIVEKDGRCAAVQCKQWKTRDVGVKPVREFLGALADAGIQNGIFITLRGYTRDAKLLAEKHGIEILDEAGLVQMLNSTDARHDAEVLELLHDGRKFCPKCESELVVRVAQKGPNPGSKFWGCANYPRCHFTLPID